MALINCPECNTEVSDKAENCPKRSYPMSWTNKKEEEKKKYNQWCIGCLGIVVAVVVILWIIWAFSDPSSVVTEKPLTVKEQQINKQFSAWDWSHTVLTKQIKDWMNNPKSYEHVETKYRDMWDHLVVLMTFRWENSFWGTVTNSVKAKVSLSWDILEILE